MEIKNFLLIKHIINTFCPATKIGIIKGKVEFFCAILMVKINNMYFKNRKTTFITQKIVAEKD